MGSKPYHDKETLERLYWDKEMSQPQLAEKFGVARTTIQYWMDKLNVKKRSDKKGGKIASSKTAPPLSMDNDGHEQFHDSDTSAYHHRLLALVDHELSEIKGKIVHHRNHVPWDNRIENLEVMTKSEHMKHHHAVRRGEKEMAGF